MSENPSNQSASNQSPANQDPASQRHHDGMPSHEQSGSPALRSFGTAWLVVGVLGLVGVVVAYVLSRSVGVWVAVPVLIVFILLGLMWRWQGSRRSERDEPPSY
ncbi:MAG: hypothetical protein H5T81_05840 [Tetrasphaera sp.]|nr:hypothetical protein [Tetrasphaera sp.]